MTWAGATGKTRGATGKTQLARAAPCFVMQSMTYAWLGLSPAQPDVVVMQSMTYATGRDWAREANGYGRPCWDWAVASDSLASSSIAR